MEVDRDETAAEDEQREQDAGDPPAGEASPSGRSRVGRSDGSPARRRVVERSSRRTPHVAASRSVSSIIVARPRSMTAARRAAICSGLNCVRCHARLVARLGLPGVVVVGDRGVRRAHLADGRPGRCRRCRRRALLVNGISSSWATTWLTRPRASASAASMKLPVKLISRARRTPIAWGSSTDSPHAGMMPSRAWVSPNLARSDATRKSQFRASSKPPVTAAPLIAPISGLPSGGNGPRLRRLLRLRAGRRAAGCRPPTPARRGRARRRTPGRRR